MTKIHATTSKSKPKQDENDHVNENEGYEELQVEPQKCLFNHSSNLDASMEEEKEPLQSFSANWGWQDKRIINNDQVVQNDADKSKITGASLFGAKADAGIKKPKNKKKKIKRI